MLFGAPDEPPVLLDWSAVARGPAVVDLSQLLFVIGAPDDRELLQGHYLDELARHGVDWPVAEVERALLAGVSQLFVTWTCAVAKWEPTTPRQEAILSVGIGRALAQPPRTTRILGALDAEHG